MVPGVARAAAGIVAVSWFAVIKVVSCGEPFQFTTALLPKLLPLMVNIKSGLPAFTLSGESSSMLGATPAVGGGAMGELYPPHPDHNIATNNTVIIFMMSSPEVDKQAPV
jgi:hypothetical protein